MAEVTPTVNPPYRDAIARALQSYYTLLTEFPYLPSSAIATPPAEGWGPQHRAVFGRLGKSATVVDVLSHIPYLSTEEFQLNYDTAPLDWRGFRVKQALDLQSGAGAGASAGSGEGGVVSLAQASLEPMLQTIPDNVISLTRPSNYGRWLLLDVDAGTMTDYSVLGGPDPKATDEEREAGAVWRKFETRPIGELFEDWSEKLRSLWWVPLPGPQGESGTIRTPVTVDDADQESFRQIYRAHGWGTDDFRKDECKAALVAKQTRQFQQLQEQYSSGKASAKRRRQEASASQA